MEAAANPPLSPEFPVLAKVANSKLASQCDTSVTELAPAVFTFAVAVSEKACPGYAHAPEKPLVAIRLLYGPEPEDAGSLDDCPPTRPKADSLGPAPDAQLLLADKPGQRSIPSTPCKPLARRAPLALSPPEAFRRPRIRPPRGLDDAPVRRGAPANPAVRRTRKRRDLHQAAHLLANWWLLGEAPLLNARKHWPVLRVFFHDLLETQTFFTRRNFLDLAQLSPQRADKTIRLKVFRMIWRRVREDEAALARCFPSPRFRRMVSLVRLDGVNHCLMKRCLKSPEFGRLFRAALHSDAFAAQVAAGKCEFLKVFDLFARLARRPKKFERLKSAAAMLFPPSRRELDLARARLFPA